MSTRTSTLRPDVAVTRPARVVVGLGYAEPSIGALAWASEASTRRLMAALVLRLTSDQEVLPVRVASGSSCSVLLGALDEDTRMLVVGRRGVGAVTRVLLGSTSIAVAGRSPVPVVVVPDDWSALERWSAPIVAGVSLDESDGGADTDDRVLRFAFDRARDLRVPLVVVHAWQVPAIYGWSPGDLADFPGRVARTLEARLEPWLAEYPEVQVTTSTVAERSADAVLKAAHGAQLAVLGRHTPASWHGALRLGSTSRQVLHDAEIPVAVIPMPVDPEHGPTPARTNSDIWGPMY
jgi:nucleotide-binding universal stress UspA family protein